MDLPAVMFSIQPRSRYSDSREVPDTLGQPRRQDEVLAHRLPPVHASLSVRTPGDFTPWPNIARYQFWGHAGLAPPPPAATGKATILDT
jgi:hypothetical protein